MLNFNQSWLKAATENVVFCTQAVSGCQVRSSETRKARRVDTLRVMLDSVEGGR